MPDPSPPPNPSTSLPLPGESAEAMALRLSATEQRLRLLIDSAADYAIFTMDRDRRVNYWNTGAERVCGFREEEILGQPGDLIFTPEDRAAGVPGKEAAEALAHGRAIDERWHLRKTGERFFASGVMTPLRDKDGEVLGFAKIMRDLTERKLGEDRLREAHEALERRVEERTAELATTNQALRTEITQRRAAEESRQEMTRLLATAQEDERLRLSRELHDEIGQHLATVMFGLNSLERQLCGTPGEPVLRNLQQLTEKIGSEVHALAVQLRPTALDDLGLHRALSAFVDTWSKQSGIKVDLLLGAVDAPRLPAPLEVAIYRIVQEALTNVLRHAQARTVSLSVNRQDDDVIVIIEDDGRGFDPDAPATTPRKGLGLLGIRERVSQFQGRLTIESAPGEGTTLLVRIPLL